MPYSGYGDYDKDAGHSKLVSKDKAEAAIGMMERARSGKKIGTEEKISEDSAREVSALRFLQEAFNLDEEQAKEHLKRIGGLSAFLKSVNGVEREQVDQWKEEQERTLRDIGTRQKDQMEEISKHGG